MQRSLFPLGATRLLAVLLAVVGLLGLTAVSAGAADSGGATTDGRGRIEATFRTDTSVMPMAPDFAPAPRKGTKGARENKGPKPKGVTKSLIVQLYWKGTLPVDDRAQLTQNVITGPDAWYRTVSHGKYGVSGTITPPLAVKPVTCGYAPHLLRKYKAEARKAAKHAGYKERRYGRFIIALPCPPTKYAGWGDTPGKFVWLYRNPLPTPLPTPSDPSITSATLAATYGSTWWTIQDWALSFAGGGTGTRIEGEEFTDPIAPATHEMGHNLGLQHAHLLQCASNGVPRSFGGHCRSVEYGDPYDVMGSRLVAGSFSAPRLKFLHWLRGKVRHVRTAATVRLSPLEGTTGTQAIAVPGKHGRTYWIEYRTATGVDAPLDPAQAGVLIRFTKPHKQATWLVDALPGSGRPYSAQNHQPELSDAEQAELLPGQSLRTPDGITITTVSQDGAAAVVQVHTPHHKKHHQKKRHHHKHKKH